MNGDGDQALLAATRITEKVVGLVKLIVLLGFLLIAGLIGIYVWLAVNPHQGDSVAGETAERIMPLITETFDKLVPIATGILKLVAPTLILFLLLALLGILGHRNGNDFDFTNITSDLPSLLALVIIATICLLPLGGLTVPDALNNIALVVVGFYFGKRDRGQRPILTLPPKVQAPNPAAEPLEPQI